MARVKIYGSEYFTPSDLPAGVTLERGDIAAVYSSGYLPAVPQEGFGWKTKAEWVIGGYTTFNLPEGRGPDEPIYASWDILEYLADYTPGGCINAESCWNYTGLFHFVNNNDAQHKRMILRVGQDIPDDAVVNYVRVWIAVQSTRTDCYWVRPYWEFPLAAVGLPASNVADRGWKADTNGRVEIANPIRGFCPGQGPSDYFVTTRSSLNTPQKSTKLTGPLVAGTTTYPMTGQVIKNMGFGYRFGKVGADGLISGCEATSPAWGSDNTTMLVCEMAVEVGFDYANYLVTTDSAAPTSTTAQLFGTVNPNGDNGGKNFFQYGLSVQLGTSTPELNQPSTTVYQSSATITGLTTNRTYYYRAVARTGSGDLVYGETKTFFTGSGCTVNTSLVGA